MSRAVRRQQQGAQKEPSGLRRPFGGKTPRQNRGAKAPAPAHRRRIGLPKWLEEIWSELRKVTWPTRDETVYLTTVVIIVATAIGLVLGGVDIFFNWLIDRLLLR